MRVKLVLTAKKIMLSSQYRVFKSESLIKEAQNFLNLDQFLNKLGEGIISNYEKLTSLGNNFKLETANNAHCFLFNINKDIIFYKYIGIESFIRKNDNRLNLILNEDFEVTIEPINSNANIQNKLYVLTNSNMNFPLLNSEQKGLVAIEDANVLIQGVAGSGKTNICIDKLIFTACKLYSGKILYSTYSKGLLIETQNKLNSVKNNLINFVNKYQNDEVIFLDTNHKKAIENRLGIYFDVDQNHKIIQKIQQIVNFLENNVDFALLQDLYSMHIKPIQKLADENYFIKNYIKSIKNHQLTSRLEKVKHLSYEVVYKEIFGLIMGSYDNENHNENDNQNENQNQNQNKGQNGLQLTQFNYTKLREGSFNKTECEVIYALAKDYSQHLTQNNLLDNNLISQELLKIQIKPYSLAIIDEVQDFTQISLYLLKKISLKMFCVGDALQMINPSYFSFAYLKRLLFEKDMVNVAQLSHNYRSTQLIANLSENLGQINIKQFGTHSFVLKCDSIDSTVETLAVKSNSKDFLINAQTSECNNYTIITASNLQKEQLRKELTKAEILTVSEIKGLERDNVVLYNILSSNYEKWKSLERITLNRKSADENSVYRYYFNLFYVALSRAKTHIYLYEEKQIPLFNSFFNNFTTLTNQEIVSNLLKTSDKLEQEQDKLIERIAQFINLSQFENARFNAQKILNEHEKTAQLTKIDIYETLVFKGKFKQAGIELWQIGLINEAREQLVNANENELVQILDASSGNEKKELGVDILSFLPQMQGNQPVKTLILDSLKRDLNNLKQNQEQISKNLTLIIGEKR